MDIRRVEMADDETRSRIVAPLAELLTRTDFAMSPRFLTLALSDAAGIDGGLIAQIYWNWLHIEVLAVPERHRGAGLGRRLVERAEAIARDDALRGVWVDTYSFQSPGFYEAMGYRPFGRLPDYPEGEERIFYAKIFGDQTQTAGEA